MCFEQNVNGDDEFLVHEKHQQWRVTAGFGWVQTHPLSKKAPMKFSQIRRLFGGWGWGWGGVGLREKKHELCQIVLNKQQHLHDAIIAFNFDH